MVKKVDVTGNADYILANNHDPLKPLTVAWSPTGLGTANVVLYGRFVAPGNPAVTFDFPLPDSKFAAATNDVGGDDLAARTITCAAPIILAKVTGYNQAFSLYAM